MSSFVYRNGRWEQYITSQLAVDVEAAAELPKLNAREQHYDNQSDNRSVWEKFVDAYYDRVAHEFDDLRQNPYPTGRGEWDSFE